MKTYPVLLVLALATPASAHNAPSGWEYDPACCASYDCAPVPEGSIREVQGGYSIDIQPGTHPMVPAGAAPLERFIPHGDSRIRASGDEHRHACISRNGHIYCVYVQAGGV